MKAITFQSMADRRRSLISRMRMKIHLESTMSFRWCKEWASVIGIYLETARLCLTAAKLFTLYLAHVLRVNKSSIQATIVSSFLMVKEQWIWMMYWRASCRKASARQQLAQTFLQFSMVKISSLICKLIPNSQTFSAKRKSSNHSIGSISGLTLKLRRASLSTHY